MLALFGCAILLFDVIPFLVFPDPRQRKCLLIFVVLAEALHGLRPVPPADVAHRGRS